MSLRPLLQLWIWVSAFAALAGWALSAFGQLNRAGYAAALALFAIFLFLQRKGLGFAREFRFSCGRKYFRRFRRPLPFSFLVLAVLIFIGGAIYPPDNYTGLTYRAGRVLQWLSHGHWFWIHTTDFRMNDRACGIEWLSAPLLLFTNSTRGLFLLNFVPFLLMPGLIFSVFRRLGVSPRVAWQWMWLFPTGYNFLLQAGGNANDTFPTVYALGAIDFALRARESGKVADLWYSILAAALLTGAKASNLPLLLPWAILILPVFPLFRKKIPITALVAVLAAVVSFLPTAILNSIYCGDWSGAVLEPPIMTVKNPFIALAGNGFQLLLGNFCPPLFPTAAWWNTHATGIVPHALVSISTHFDSGFFQLGELPTEDMSGIGFGLSALLAITVFAKIFGSHTSTPARRWVEGERLRRLMLLAPWLALIVYCAKSGMTAPARLIAPYYPLLLPLLLTGAGPAQLIRHRWWHAVVGLVLLTALAVLVLSPDRPLWPAQTILGRLATRYPNNHSIARARDVYTVYARRSDPLANVRALLPPDIRIVGFLGTADDCDISFWLPLGSRRVEHFLLTDPPRRFQQEGVEYAVVSGLNLELQNVTLEDWLQRTDAQVIASTNGVLKVTDGPRPWYVVQFKP